MMEEEKKEVRISPRTGQPVKTYIKRKADDGRRNNGGKRKGAGRKRTEDDERKITYTCYIQRKTKMFLNILALDYEMSCSEYLDTIIAEQYAKRKK